MKTVLVVDDDPSIRALIRLYLEGAGYGVIEAADGRRGMQALSEQAVDLVVLDIFMANAADDKLLRRLKKTGEIDLGR